MRKITTLIGLLAILYGGYVFALGEGGIQGGGSTNASNLSSGTVATARGGTGADTSATTGFIYINSGTWTFDNQVTFESRLTNLAPLVSPSFTTPTLGAASATTLNTGQGAYELYAMDQNVRTTDNVVFGTVTASEFVSSAADNTRGTTIGNTADPTGANLADGKLWFNQTSDMVKVRGADNASTLEVFTSGAAHTLNFATTGTLSGGIPILDNVSGPTAAQMYGSLNLVNAAITVLLPTAVAGMSGCIMDSGAAHDIIVDVQAGDNVVLVGSVGAGGVGITNASGSSTGDYVCLVAAQANKWYVMGKQGTWASQ